MAPPAFRSTVKHLLGETFLRQDGSAVGKDAIEGKTLGIYFSAHWCPPCRGFTPVLRQFYSELKLRDPDFEIVFVSQDHGKQEMMEYFRNDHGGYLALPYEKREDASRLSALFDVKGIPTFVVLGPDGQLLNANARGKVTAGADAVLSFGWEPPIVGDLGQGAEAGGRDINSCPSVVVICDKASVVEQSRIEAALQVLAKGCIDDARAGGGEPKYIFFVAKSGGLLDQLRGLTESDAGPAMQAAGDSPVTVLFDIPDQGAFYLSSANGFDSESVTDFLASHQAGNERRLQLKRPQSSSL